MGEYKSNRIAQVVKVEGPPMDTWHVYIHTAEQWEKCCNSPEPTPWMDVFSATDETTALSRARMVYPNFVIGDNPEGVIKEWR